MWRKIIKYRSILVWIVCALVFLYFLGEMLPVMQGDGMGAIVGAMSLVFVGIFVIGSGSIVTGIGKLYEKGALTKWHLLGIRVFTGAGMVWWAIAERRRQLLNASLTDSTLLTLSRIVGVVGCLLVVRGIYRLVWNKDKPPTQAFDYGPLRWNVLSIFGVFCIGRLIYTLFRL